MTRHSDDAGHKEKFLLERIAFFSDAVFAIAITLLIIEIKVPDIDRGNVTDEALLDAIVRLIPKFIGFFVSFFVIGLYWMSHHRLFRYLERYNARLLWINLWFLLTLVLMPFSAAFLSDYYDGRLKVPLGFYMVNIGFSGLFSYLLWRTAGNPAQQLTDGLHPAILRYNATRALATPFIFVLVFIISFIWPTLVYVILPLTPVVSALIRRHYRRKYPEIMRLHS